MTLLAHSPPEREGGRKRRPAALSTGTGMALVLSVGTALAGLAVPPLASVLQPLYLLGAMALAGYWLGRDHERMVEGTLWLWVLAPGVRRCLDLTSGYHADSLVLLAAPAASLVCGLGAWRACLGSTGPVRRLLLRVLVAVCYAGGVSVALGVAPQAVVIASVQVLGPLALGAALLVPQDRARLVVSVQRFSVWALLLVGGYGVVQYLVAPAWDRQWLIDVSDVAKSFGKPAPLEIRVFSTVNDPGSLALVLVLCILVVLTSRRPGGWGVFALLVGASCLGLTLVRSAWIVLAVALVFLVLRGWIRPERLTALVVSLAMALTVFGTAASPVVERFTSSTSSGSQDVSFQARLSFQTTYLASTLLDPVGTGLGSTGTAARRDQGGDQAFVNTDSGYLELLRTYGGLIGSLLIVSIVGTCWAMAVRRAQWWEGSAAFAFAVPVQLVFSNVLVGVSGVVLWVALALAWQQRGQTVSTGREIV